MNTVWIESESASWECGEPGCCFEAWTEFRVTANGQVYEVNDRDGKDLLAMLLPLLGYVNWRIDIEDAETTSDSFDPTRAETLEFVARNRWNSEETDVVSCHLVVRTRDGVLLDQVYKTFPCGGVTDDQWLATQFLAAIGWTVA